MAKRKPNPLKVGAMLPKKDRDNLKFQWNDYYKDYYMFFKNDKGGFATTVGATTARELRKWELFN